MEFQYQNVTVLKICKLPFVKRVSKNVDELLLKCCGRNGTKARNLIMICTSRHDLSNKWLLEKFAFDPAENELGGELNI